MMYLVFGILVFGIYDAVFGIWGKIFGIWDAVLGIWDAVFGIYDAVFGTGHHVHDHEADQWSMVSDHVL